MSHGDGAITSGWQSHATFRCATHYQATNIDCIEFLDLFIWYKLEHKKMRKGVKLWRLNLVSISKAKWCQNTSLLSHCDSLHTKWAKFGLYRRLSVWRHILLFFPHHLYVVLYSRVFRWREILLSRNCSVVYNFNCSLILAFSQSCASSHSVHSIYSCSNWFTVE